MAEDDVSAAAGGLAEQGLGRTQEQSDLEQMSDQALIAVAGDPRHQMEIQRRLKDAVAKLTAEIVRFRKSSDAAAKNLQRLTYLLVVLTCALVGLTIDLAVNTPQPSPPNQPHPVPSVAPERQPSRATPEITPRR